MKARTARNVMLAAALSVPLLLAGCSSDSGADTSAADQSSASAAASASPAPKGTQAPGQPQPKVTIAPEVKEQLDVKAGEAVVPGSITTTKQELGPVCTEAVKPLRDIMAKYKSGFLVPGAERVALSEAMNSGRAECEKDNAQDWTNFYANEFAGWFYAKTQ